MFDSSVNVYQKIENQVGFAPRIFVDSMGWWIINHPQHDGRVGLMPLDDRLSVIIWIAMKKCDPSVNTERHGLIWKTHHECRSFSWRNPRCFPPGKTPSFQFGVRHGSCRKATYIAPDAGAQSCRPLERSSPPDRRDGVKELCYSSGFTVSKMNIMTIIYIYIYM